MLDAGGSCIGIVLTDIPLDARQLERVARRVGLGLGQGRVRSPTTGAATSSSPPRPRTAAGACADRFHRDATARRQVARRGVHRGRRRQRGGGHERAVRRRHRHRRRRPHRPRPARRPRARTHPRPRCLTTSVPNVDGAVSAQSGFGTGWRGSIRFARIQGLRLVGLEVLILRSVTVTSTRTGHVRTNTGGVMKRLIAVAVLVAGLSGGLGRPRRAHRTNVTLTVGLLQDMSSPERHGRLPRARVRRLEPAVRHADRQGGRRLRDDPRPGRVVGGVGRRADLHVHPARGAAVVRRRAADRRGRRLHDQPLARRGVVEPLLDHASTSTPRRSTSAPSRSRARCPTRSCRRWTSTSSPSTSTSRSTPTRSSSTTPSTASPPARTR